MRLGIVMPVVLQNEIMLSMTLETLKLIKPGVQWSFHLLCNRLTIRTASEMVTLMRECFSDDQPSILECISDRERTVAGAWNEGIRRAVESGSRLFLVMANDARLSSECVPTLLSFEGGADLWTAGERRIQGVVGRVSNSADFSVFMLPLATFEKYGSFDENFKPAYFEDNDYYARILLGGGSCKLVHDAVYHHLGSQTTKRDAEFAIHVKSWWEKNRDYFVRKWGCIPLNGLEIFTRYHKTPFNSGKPLSWWELEPGRGYDG